MYKIIYKKINSWDGVEHNLPRGIVIGDKEIIFPCSIKTIHDENYIHDKRRPNILEIKDLIIICFYPFTQAEIDEMKRLGLETERNVWAFDQKGNKVWEIMPPIYKPDTFSSILIKDQTKIEKNWVQITHEPWAKIPDGSLIARSFKGHEYLVDIKTGKVEVIKGVS